MGVGDREPRAASAAGAAGAALGQVALDPVVAQGEAAAEKVDAAALGVAAGATVAAGPAGRVPRGRRLATGPGTAAPLAALPITATLDSARYRRRSAGRRRVPGCRPG